MQGIDYIGDANHEAVREPEVSRKPPSPLDERDKGRGRWCHWSPGHPAELEPQLLLLLLLYTSLIN